VAEFQYVGINKDGRPVKGKLEAPGSAEFKVALRNLGIRPLQIKKMSDPNSVSGLKSLMKSNKIVPVEAVITATRQLQVLIGAGIPLVQGLEMLTDQSASLAMKPILIEVKEKVSQGAFLWETLSHYPLVFPKLYVALIKAGEASGSLDQMLKRLSRYLEDSDRTKKLISGAMMYPVIVILIGLAVVTGMIVFVVPKFEDMLTGAGQELPLPTKVLIEISHFFARNYVPILAVTFVFVLSVGRYLKSDEGKALKDRLTFKLPIFGELAQKGAIARFTRTMQTLLASGVTLIDAVDICKSTLDNVVLEESVGKIRSEIEKGKTMGVVLNSIPIFPKMVVQMVMIGESTGNLDRMLEKVADLYEEEVSIMVGGLGKLIEPIVIVVLGSMVGGIMIAMYLPIFKLSGGVE
jgi:type IV pilus assembly protein PilC